VGDVVKVDWRCSRSRWRYGWSSRRCSHSSRN
jgi:hypothetical protein